MDWDFAIRRKRTELGAIVAALLAMVAACASRQARNAVLRMLRPAESTLRRLIVIYCREKPVAKADTRVPAPLPDFSAFSTGGKDRAPAFRLIDPCKRFGLYNDESRAPSAQGEPRIWALGMAIPGAQDAPALKTTPNMASLKRRIAALDHALKTLPVQARRLKRLMARRKQAPPGPGRTGPIRPGWPPGYRQKPQLDIDLILSDCHALAVGKSVWPP